MRFMRFAAVTVAVAVLATLGLPARAQDQPDARREPVLTVRGHGTSEQAPEFARFEAVVSTKGGTLEDASSPHATRATQAAAVLKELEPEGVSTTSSRFQLFRDQPVHRTPPAPGITILPPQPAPSFTAQTTFTISVRPVASISAIVTRLAQSGLFEVHSVYFGVDNTREALNRARRAAMADAREQAQAYADGGEFRLLEIVRVTDADADVGADAAADLPMVVHVQIIPPAVVTFDARAEVTWRIGPR